MLEEIVTLSSSIVHKDHMKLDYIPLSARKQQSRFREAQLLPTGLLREEVRTLVLSREVLRRQSTEHVYKQPLPHVKAVILVQEYGEDTSEENLV